MAEARLIVCERSGQWAVALRRELNDSGVRLYETRCLPDCWQALAEAPASFLVIELTAQNIEPLLACLARMPREFPSARAAVAADRTTRAYEWLVREAGAVHFVCSPRCLAPLAAVALRHLADVPAPQQTMVERIWASLPWKRA
jgi:hypothetical protein